MKELILVRHAKSDWGDEGLKDIDRHLSERGYGAAYLQGEWLLNEKSLPELVISSSAIRAISTALILIRSLKLDLSLLKIDALIYESSVNTLLSIIEGQNDAVSSVMIVGHNPTMTDLCNHLTGDLYFDNIPTCGIVSFSLKSDSWKDITKGKTKLNYYKFPKDLKIRK